VGEEKKQEKGGEDVKRGKQKNMEAKLAIGEHR
jgi:hypothetical protein